MNNKNMDMPIQKSPEIPKLFLASAATTLLIFKLLGSHNLPTTFGPKALLQYSWVALYSGVHNSLPLAGFSR